MAFPLCHASCGSVFNGRTNMFVKRSALSGKMNNHVHMLCMTHDEFNVRKEDAVATKIVGKGSPLTHGEQLVWMKADLIKDEVDKQKIEIREIESRMSKSVDELKRVMEKGFMDITTCIKELKTEVDDMKKDFNGKMDDMKKEFDGKMDDMKKELKEKMDDMKKELNEKFDDIGIKLFAKYVTPIVGPICGFIFGLLFVLLPKLRILWGQLTV